MKKKEIQDLKNRSAIELVNLEKESREKLRTLRFDLAAGKVKNVAELHELKKKIARIQTFLKSNAHA
jgi:ribosomal protein L29